MLDVAAFPPNYFGSFFLVFIRVGAMLFSAPLLNGRAVPAMAKIGFGLLITMLLMPINGAHLVEVPFQWLPLSLLVIKEMGVGVLVGFTTNLVFQAMQLAGQFVGMQTGFSVAKPTATPTTTAGPHPPPLPPSGSGSVPSGVP